MLESKEGNPKGLGVFAEDLASLRLPQMWKIEKNEIPLHDPIM